MRPSSNARPLARIARRALTAAAWLALTPGTVAASSCCQVAISSEVSSGSIWRGQRYNRSPTARIGLELTWGPTYLVGAGSWSVDGDWAEQDLLGALILPAPGGGDVGFVAAGYRQSGDASVIVEVALAYRGVRSSTTTLPRRLKPALQLSLREIRASSPPAAPLGLETQNGLTTRRVVRPF